MNISATNCKTLFKAFGTGYIASVSGEGRVYGKRFIVAPVWVEDLRIPVEVHCVGLSLNDVSLRNLRKEVYDYLSMPKQGNKKIEIEVFLTPLAAKELAYAENWAKQEAERLCEAETKCLIRPTS